MGKDIKKIDRLKQELDKSFAMKDLGSTKQILGMEITCDRSGRKLWLSQEWYIEKVLERFNMNAVKPVSTPLDGHFRLSDRQCPKTKAEMDEM